MIKNYSSLDEVAYYTVFVVVVSPVPDKTELESSYDEPNLSELNSIYVYRL